jgi:hypothetical protein
MRPKMKKWKGERTKYCHVKLDGHYLQVTKLDSGRVVFTSKQGTELDLSFVPSLLNVCMGLQSGQTCLGELWYEGQPASYIKTAIKHKDRKLRFTAFALTHLPDDTLETMHMICLKSGIDMAEWYGPTQNCLSTCLGVFDPTSLPPMEHEGFVMKDGVWTNWMKHKPFDTIDLIVDSVVEGKGKHIGLIGSLVCRTAEGYIVANAGGFTDEERIYLSEDDIGRVVEVKYQLVGSKGKLRHPTFVRFRDDKRADDCYVSQDEDLEAYYDSKKS